MLNERRGGNNGASEWGRSGLSLLRGQRLGGKDCRDGGIEVSVFGAPEWVE